MDIVFFPQFHYYKNIMQGEHIQPEPGAEKQEQKLDPRTPEAMLTAVGNNSPRDIVELERYCKVEGWMNHQKSRTEQLSERDKHVNEIGDALAAALEVLPQHDLDRARAIFSQQAESPLSIDRSAAGFNICASRIGEYDHDFAMEHLSRLVRDHDDDVRRDAYTMIEATSFDSLPTAEERAQTLESQVGLSEQDAWHLHHAYLEAQEGHNLYDPQREAFDRVMGSLGADQS